MRIPGKPHMWPHPYIALRDIKIALHLILSLNTARARLIEIVRHEFFVHIANTTTVCKEELMYVE